MKTWKSLCLTVTLTLFVGGWKVAEINGGELKLIGTHPTSTLTPFPSIHTMRFYKDKLYFGYGDWYVFPAVTIASYLPKSNVFAIEFSPGTDSIETFREIAGTLYALCIDPSFNEESRDYSYLSEYGWRDVFSVGMAHVFDLGTLDGSDLWMVGSKNVNETSSYGACVLRSTDSGRNWQDLTMISSLAEGRYYWGFALRNRFYVRDTYYQGTNATRTAAASYVRIRKATAVGHGTNQFMVGAGSTVEEPGHGAARLVTFDSQSWRTLRSQTIDFALSGTNLLTLESRAIWMASDLTVSQASWRRLDFTNVPPDARAIEVADNVVYIGDAQGRLWVGQLEDGILDSNAPTVLNALSDDFGRALSFDGDRLAVGAPDHSGTMPLSGQASIWQQVAGVGWRRTATIDPPTPSFSGWFGKDLALKDGVLAVVEGGRDLSRTNRGGSAQVHLYERRGEDWSGSTNLSIPFAQSVAIDSGWLAVGAGTLVGQPTTKLLFYTLSASGSRVEAKLRTNIVVRSPQQFWKPAAHVALEGDICALASTSDGGSFGAPGEVRIYQRDAADTWRLLQVLRSDSPPSTPYARGNWMYDAASGVWHVDGEHAKAGAPTAAYLSSPPIAITRPGTVHLTFHHRWSFEQEGGTWEGGQVRVSINAQAYTTVPGTAFITNGYNGRIAANTISELLGQPAFVRKSPGHAAVQRVETTCSLGALNAGDTLSFQFVYAGNHYPTIGNVPNWEIDSVTLTEGLPDEPGALLLSEDLSTNDGGFIVQTQAPWGPDRFGFALALQGGWLAVGAPRDDRAAHQAGAVHLYERTNSPGGAAFVLRQSLSSPFAQAEAAFGTSVALKGSTLLVGCPGAELDGQRHHGAVFVYQLDGDIWRKIGEVAPPEASDAEFGTRVALGSEWFAASSRFSQSSPALADRMAIHRLNLPGGELKAKYRRPHGPLELSLRGDIGRTYNLQATSDLASGDWADLGQVTLTTPVTNVLDSTAPALPQRYYRLSSQNDP